MTMIEQIKALSLQARKERNAAKAALYSTLLGDAQMVGKNNGNRESTDSEVIAVVKKMVANTKETRALIACNLKDLSETHQVVALSNEIEWLEALLPQQLSTNELEHCIDTLIACYGAKTIKDMGKVMKKLKEDFDGHYDGTEASKIVKEKLSVNI